MLGRLFVATSRRYFYLACQTAFRRLNCRLLSSDKRPLAGPGIKVYVLSIQPICMNIRFGIRTLWKTFLRTTMPWRPSAGVMSQFGFGTVQSIRSHFGGRSGR